MFQPCLLLCLTLLFSVGVSAQNQFIRTFGSTGFDVGNDLIQTADDGYVLIGSTGSFGFESSQVIMVRVNHKGDHLWNRYFGGELADVGESVAQTIDGGFIITGFTETVDSTYNILVVRTDSEGEPLWQRTFGGENWDLGKQVIALADGGFAVSGITYSTSNGQGDAFILRLDEEGEVIWMQTYGGEMTDGANSITVTQDGGFVIAGFTESWGNGGKDVWVVRVNDVGDVVWSNPYGSEEDDFANAVIATSDGGFAMCGATEGGGFGGFDFYTLKVKGDGSLDWDPQVSPSSGPNDDVWTDIIYNDVSGELTMVGYSANPAFGGPDENMYISRIYSNGGWWANLTRVYGGAGDDRAYGVVQTSDEGYALVGLTDGYLERMTDIMLVKVDYDGNDVPFTLDVQELEHEGTTFRAVMAPNPSPGPVTLHLEGHDRWASSLAGPVILEVMDILGRPVLSMPVSSSHTVIDLSDQPQGLYAYRVYSGARVLVAGRLVRNGH